MTNAISRKKCGGWFRMRAGVLVRGTPLQCIYPSVLIQKYLEKMPWICPYISRHLLSLNPLLACCRRYSRGER
ncbi:hypothetical protein FCZ47_29025 [Escherichia coli]|nr:hypothetical protein [Escherichia coli]